MGFYHSCLVAQQNLSFSFCCSCRLQLRLGCRKPFIQCRRLSGLNNSRKCNTQFSKTAKFIDFVTGYLTLFTQLLSIVKASMAALLGSLPQYHPIVGNAAEQQELSGQRSLSLFIRQFHFLHAWRNVFIQSLCSRMSQLLESLCSTYSGHWRESYFHSFPLHLAVLRVGLQGASQNPASRYSQNPVQHVRSGSHRSVWPWQTTVRSFALDICTCQVMRLVLMNINLVPFQERSVLKFFDVKNLLILACWCSSVSVSLSCISSSMSASQEI